jgi:hypothetical protein
MRKDHFVYLGTKATVILKQILKKRCVGIDTDSIILTQ